MVYATFNLRKKTTGLLIDFEKAFDLVDCTILLSKIGRVGNEGHSLELVPDFSCGQSTGGQSRPVREHSTARLGQAASRLLITATLFIISLTIY